KSSLTNVQGWAYLGMARCYEGLGEEQRATDAYRALLADHPQHPKAEEARANIARLTHSLDKEAPEEGLRDGMPDGVAPGMD
ncbi:MAG: tetratricopeptide repeat protein, partial [Thermodesulfobacteriota bacterium]